MHWLPRHLWPLLVGVVLGVMPLVAEVARAQEDSGATVVLREQEVWGYAERLFRQREYYRAVSEYKRLTHFFAAGRLRWPAELRIGEAYLNGGEPEQAVAHFTALLGDDAPGLPRSALLYLRAIGRLDVNSHLPYPLREPHVEAALADLRAIPAEWIGTAGVAGFVSAIESPPEELPSKSPWLAGGLSVLLPGAGSVYVGRYSEGALSFFINALFIGATVNAVDKDDDDLAVVLGIGALAFYGGNIYAAANGAHKFNDRVRAAYLLQQRVRFGLLPRPEGWAGVLQLRF